MRIVSPRTIFEEIAPSATFQSLLPTHGYQAAVGAAKGTCTTSRGCNLNREFYPPLKVRLSSPHCSGMLIVDNSKTQEDRGDGGL